MPGCLHPIGPLPAIRCFGAVCVAVLLCGCHSPSLLLDCSLGGEVRGGYAEINSGELQFAHGVIWTGDDAGYTVLFSRDGSLIDALRRSPQPEVDAHLAAQMMGELLVGFRFAADGEYLSHFTAGTSTSSGSGGGDYGDLQLDEQGCARGNVQLSYNGGGSFALPLQHPDQIARALSLEVEAGSEPALERASADSFANEPDALQRWAELWSTLQGSHPALALQALGLSSPAADALAGDRRLRDAVQRVATQCPAPGRASLDDYGDVVGDAQPRSGVVLSGTVLTSYRGGAAQLDNCYVMQRNGEWIDQCWPLTTDCTATPLYRPDR